MLVHHLVDLEYEVSLYLIYFLMVEIVGYFFDKKMVGNLFEIPRPLHFERYCI